MPQFRTVAIAAMSGIAGLIIGAVAAAWFTSFFFGHGMITGSLATLVVEGAALEKMHAGDIDGASLILDRSLDGELIIIRYAIDDGFELPSKGASAIARIKRVRESTGYLPADPSVRESVDAALRLGQSDE